MRNTNGIAKRCLRLSLFLLLLLAPLSLSAQVFNITAEQLQQLDMTIETQQLTVLELRSLQQTHLQTIQELTSLYQRQQEATTQLRQQLTQLEAEAQKMKKSRNRWRFTSLVLIGTAFTSGVVIYTVMHAG